LFYIFLVFLTFSFFFYLYICQKNLENTFCGAILIVSRQYGWKMFRSSFDDFSGLGAFKGRKVENGAKMTQFSARNIPTLFEVQFLSFPINTAKKCFGWILTTKLKIGPEWLGFAPKTYPHYLRCNFYRSLSVRTKNVLVECWQLFGAWAPSKQEKLKTGPRWLGLAPRTYPHFFECTSYCFTSAWLKNILLEFWRLFWTWIPREEAKLKIKPGWLDFAPET